MKNRKEINNVFFDLIAMFISFFMNILRWFYIFFSQKKINMKINIFFNFLDFIFRKWTKYFWEKPSFYKLTSLLWDIINYLINKKYV